MLCVDKKVCVFGVMTSGDMSDYVEFEADKVEAL